MGSSAVYCMRVSWWWMALFVRHLHSSTDAIRDLRSVQAANTWRAACTATVVDQGLTIAAIFSAERPVV